MFGHFTTLYMKGLINFAVLTISGEYFYFIPPENTRKNTFGFLVFSGDLKIGTLSRRGLKFNIFNYVEVLFYVKWTHHPTSVVLCCLLVNNNLSLQLNWLIKFILLSKYIFYYVSSGNRFIYFIPFVYLTSVVQK